MQKNEPNVFYGLAHVHGWHLLRIATDRREALSSLLYADIATSDILLEGGEQLLESGVVVAEQGRLGNASRVHCVEDNVLGLMEAAMHLKDC